MKVEKLTEKQWKEKEEAVRTLKINMETWSWDVVPQFKIEAKDKDIVIEAIQKLYNEILLRGIVKKCSKQ